ncbi:MAG: CDP-diacylglycerol---glycerol-3-phosphate 3-phosphatidyltransferase [Gammaproteobacteria bacterium]|jgi:CDP-diacylglycerol--glycerol-3-phosphate 3-phosphatidyltransferase|nr:CDP-diacylglycerol--glycerol-3-phosphate 3-phosphatidyltransferase [Gammaproteobacteria bacterium]MEA3140992.1 CDP-diacylglycerol---glycerol-3-phosphate 3-phosphatidyltransferase [Gammaproteobacteria bacterium]
MNTSIPVVRPKSHWNLPNTLTWLRILMIPGVVILFYLPFWWAHPAAGVGFALAGITDSLDGYFARKLGLTSRLGAFLDPVADKLIVAAALVLIVSADPRWFVVIMATVIIGREIAVSALREWMAEIGARGRIKVSMLAKYKTIMQIFGLSMMLFRHDLLTVPIYRLGLILTAVAAVLTLWSMIAYLRLAWPELRDSSNL